MLPGLDGKGVWPWLVRHRPSIADRVAFMTGDISTASYDFAQETGRGLLTKPLAMDRLSQVVNEVLARSTEASEGGGCLVAELKEDA